MENPAQVSQNELTPSIQIPPHPPAAPQIFQYKRNAPSHLRRRPSHGPAHMYQILHDAMLEAAHAARAVQELERARDLRGVEVARGRRAEDVREPRAHDVPRRFRELDGAQQLPVELAVGGDDVVGSRRGHRGRSMGGTRRCWWRGRVWGGFGAASADARSRGDCSGFTCSTLAVDRSRTRSRDFYHCPEVLCRRLDLVHETAEAMQAMYCLALATGRQRREIG
nr:hypothetical protein CFP56_01211 [Quercus suber]